MNKLILEDYDKYVYENELKDFLPDKIFDCHVHLYKKDIPYINPPKKPTWVGRVTEEMSKDELPLLLKTFFPDKTSKALIFGWTNREYNAMNEYVRESGAALNYPTLYRTNYAMPADKLEEDIKKGGFLGIKPYRSDRAQYIPLNETRIFDFLPHSHLEVCDRNGWIVMLHIPRDMRLKDPVNLYQIAEIEEKYPNLKLIIAHIGRAYAKEDIGNAFDIIGRGKNTYFDFTANLCEDAIKACIEAVGTDKLLFGSDLPVAKMRMYRIVENGYYINIIRRGEYGDMNGVAHMRESDEKDVTFMIYEQIKALKNVAFELKLKDNDIEKIMFANAEKMIKELI